PTRILSALVVLAAVPTARADKDDLVKAVDAKSDAAWEMAKKIWDWAEPGYQEKQSSALLADALEKAGFKVERGVAKIPTAFTATFGEGKPVIGILGEYDALPELSQDAVPFRQPREGGSGYGQACGHHLFGVASATAAMAVAEQIKAGTIKGTVRFYGCPAGEGGAAKAFMARAALFSDCDACLHWHPGSRNQAGDSSCLARIAVKFPFHGKAPHARGPPPRGASGRPRKRLARARSVGRRRRGAAHARGRAAPRAHPGRDPLAPHGHIRRRGSQRRPGVRGGVLLRPPPEVRDGRGAVPATAEVRP